MDATSSIMRYSATTDDLERYANALDEEVEKLQEIGRSPHQQRVLRTFRYSDAQPYMRSIGERRWQTWVQQHVMTEAEREKARMAAPGTLAPHRLTLTQVHALMDHYRVRPTKPANGACMVTAFAQFKGGSAKTTSCLHFGHYLALRGYKVLVIDMDPQATLSRFLGLSPMRIDDTETFMAAFTNPELVLIPRPTHFDGLDVLPANMNLNKIDIDLAVKFKQNDRTALSFYTAVAEATAKLKAPYDFILLDTPPAFSLSQISLLWGVNSMVVPIPPEGADVAGAADFFRNTASMTKIVENWEQERKEWAPFVVIHPRDKGSAHGELIKGATGRALGHLRLSHTIPDTKAVSSSQDLYKSVYEVIGSEVDLRQVKRARESMDVVWAALEDIFQWEWQYASKAEG